MQREEQGLVAPPMVEVPRIKRCLCRLRNSGYGFFRPACIRESVFTTSTPAVRLTGTLHGDAGADAAGDSRPARGLRTHFAVVEGQPVQVIEEQVGSAAEAVDLSGWPGGGEGTGGETGAVGRSAAAVCAE